MAYFCKSQFNIYRISPRTWDWPREVVSTGAHRARAETTRGPIPGPRSKVECEVVYIICLKQKLIEKKANLKCICIFWNLKRILFCSNACIHVLVQVVELCWQSFVIWLLSMGILSKCLYVFWIYEGINLYIPLQISMHLSGRFRLFVQNFGVLFFEKSKI